MIKRILDEWDAISAEDLKNVCESFRQRIFDFTKTKTDESTTYTRVHQNDNFREILFQRVSPIGVLCDLILTLTY